jgi:hypothetical protein
MLDVRNPQSSPTPAALQILISLALNVDRGVI